MGGHACAVRLGRMEEAAVTEDPNTEYCFVIISHLTIGEQWRE